MTKSDSIPQRTFPLALGALGVVFGDIGTSPLYTVKECFHGLHAISPTETNLLGVLSLIFWSLTVVISVKYVGFILRADNRGEGGIFALLALIPREKKNSLARFDSVILIAAVFGAALLYGDGIITPAISVLAAIEGISVGSMAAKPLVLPLTCLILASIFMVQRGGTASIGSIFGPFMTVWFITIGALGLAEIVKAPQVLRAVNPVYAYRFFFINHFQGIVVLGSVVLCITGGEALYADLGHFGRKAIRLSWLAVALPALLINYFGQVAVILNHPNLAFNPFYALVPSIFLYPMVALSTIATIIASQAMITGVFSLTQQAVQLGFLPRVQIVHTSPRTRGQIYLPAVNYVLMIACIGLVLTFRHASNLAAAYGIAVTATMGITSILYFFVISRAWKWPPWKAVPPLVLFLIFDISYFGANVLKIPYGGWFTLAVAAVIAAIMITWRDGRAELTRKMESNRLPMEDFLTDVARHKVQRVHGTAVFMTISTVGTPPSLLHHLKHNHALHKTVILLSIRSMDIPLESEEKRLKIDTLGQGFYRIVAHYGFMEKPNVPDIMRIASAMGLPAEPPTTTFYLGRETLLTTGDSRMMQWRKHLFAFMSRNARAATVYFGIPPGRVVELGIQIEL